MPPGLTSLLPPGANLFPFSPTPNFFFPPNTVFPTIRRVNLVPFVGVAPLLTGGLTLPGALPLVVGLSGETDFAPNGERALMMLMKSPAQTSSTGAGSASDLNRLLDDLKASPSRSGPDVALSEEVVRHIHLSPSTSTGNAELLQIGPWPELLQRSAFQDERGQIEAFIPELARQARAGSVQAADLENLAETVNDMRLRLAGLIRDVPAPPYIRAKRFLVNLQDVVKVLGQPDAVSHFNPMIETPRAKSVRELVQYMIKHDLRFAQARAGDEAAYRTFYRALASYEASAKLQAPSAGNQVAAVK